MPNIFNWFLDLIKGGVQAKLFGKVDLEIWVYQEGPPTGGTFDGVLESPYPLCPARCPRLYMGTDRHHF